RDSFVCFSIAFVGGECCHSHRAIGSMAASGSLGVSPSESGSLREGTMMKLGIPRTVLATSFALAILIALVSGLWAEGGQSKTDANPSPLAKGLIGTWDLAGTPDKEEEPPAKGGRLKFITGKHWTLTHYDEAGKVTVHHGGTCTF